MKPILKKMFFKAFILCAALLMAVSAVAEQGAVFLTSPAYMQVMSMSPNGKWACGIVGDGSSILQGALWNIETGEVTYLSTTDESSAYAVTDDGVVCGGYTDYTLLPTGFGVYVAGYYKDGEWHRLDNSPMADEGVLMYNSEANAISADGRVVVGYVQNTNSDRAPARWVDGKLDCIFPYENAGVVYAVSRDGANATGWGYQTDENNDRNRSIALWIEDSVEYLSPRPTFAEAGRGFSPDGSKLVCESFGHKFVYDLVTKEKTSLPWINPMCWGQNISFIGMNDIVLGGETFKDEATGASGGYGYVYDMKAGKAYKFDQWLKENYGAEIDTKTFITSAAVAMSDDAKTFAIYGYPAKNGMMIGEWASMIIKLDQEVTYCPPVALKATKLFAVNNVRLTWNAPLMNADNVIGYRIYRDDVEIAEIASDMTTYTDAQLADGQYSYAVAALYDDENGEVVESEKSTSVTAIVAPDPLPQAQNIEFKATNYNDLRLRWDAPIFDYSNIDNDNIEKHTVLGYDIYRNNEKIATVVEQKFLDEGLAEGQYTYGIVAKYLNGESAPANIDIKFKANADALRAIEEVAVEVGTADIKATWDAPVKNDASVVSYAMGVNSGKGITRTSTQDVFEFAVAHAYPYSVLNWYEGYTIDALRFYPSAEAEFAIALEVNGVDHEFIVLGQIGEEDGYTLNTWNNIKLENPYTIKNGDFVRVKLLCTDVVPGTYPITLDDQPGKMNVSDLYCWDYNGQYSSAISDGGHAKGNWMIGMMVSNGNTELLPVKGYNVVIDGNEVGAMIAETTFTANNLNWEDANTHNIKINTIYNYGIENIIKEGKQHVFNIMAEGDKFTVDGIHYEVLTETDEVAVTYYEEYKYTGSVVIPESVSYQGVTFSVTSIGEWAFAYCNELVEIVIPNSVTAIGWFAFSDCTGLTEITIPNSVASIGEGAFARCSLKKIVIPSSVTSIGKGAFCSYYLTSIVVEEGNTVYDSRENCNAIIETATNTLIAGCMNTVILNSVTTIGEYAFGYCEGLTEVTIPNSVTTIGDHAFYYCTGLNEMRVEAVEPPAIAESTFAEVDKTIPLYVPAESVEAYRTAEYWSEFTNILSIPVENPGEPSANRLQADDVTVAELDGVLSQARVALPIALVNKAAISAVQCDIYLPAGLSIATTESGMDIALSDRASESHTLMTRALANGAVRIVIMSASAEALTGNEGTLFTLGLLPNENYNTESQIVIRNITMTDTDIVEYTPEQVVVNCRIRQSILGDANRDNKINVTDIVLLAKYILNDYHGDFDALAGDVNQDGEINVSDIVAMANKILSGEGAAGAPTRKESEKGTLRMDEVQINGENSATASLMLDNSVSYSAFQMDVILPDGVEIAAIERSERISEHHQLMWKVQADGRVRILVFAIDNSVIAAQEGALFDVQLRAQSGFTAGELQVTAATFVTRGTTTHHIDDLAVGVSRTSDLTGNHVANRVYATGRTLVIESSEAQEARITTADGLSQSIALQPGRNEYPMTQQGVYIVTLGNENKKVIVK